MILEKKSQTSTSRKSSQDSKITQKKSNLWSIILLIVLVISNVFWFYQYKDLNKRYDSLKNKFEPSKIQIEKLNNQLQQIKSAKEIFDEAFNNVNQDISEATKKTYKTEMGNVQKSLSDSVEKLN